MLQYNSLVLKKLVLKIQPDIIFYADGFFMFPAYENKSGRIKLIADVQDDFDGKDFSVYNSIRDKQIKNFSKTTDNFTISKVAALSLGSYYQTTFQVLPNGADFEHIQKVSDTEVSTLKKKLGIENKYILSFIGSTAKFDIEFTKSLAKELHKELPDVVLMLVGSLPKLNLSNVFNVGVVSYEETSVYFRMSDVGVILNDTSKNDFLKNSFPLKVIQYAAARKPVLTFPMDFIEDIKSDNIFVAKTLEQWLDKVKLIKQTFIWSSDLDELWRHFDWNILVKEHVIKKSLNQIKCQKKRMPL